MSGLPEGGSGRSAYLELHAIGISKEQRPDIAQLVNVADIGAGGDEPVADLVEGGTRCNGDAVVVDRAAAA